MTSCAVISYAPVGLAFINAIVFAKVMLIAEKLRIGTRFRKKAPVFPIFYKSLLFALTFICFNLAEEVIIGLWKGKTIAQSIPRIGGGSPAGTVIAGLIMTIALIPFSPSASSAVSSAKVLWRLCFLNRSRTLACAISSWISFLILMGIGEPIN